MAAASSSLPVPLSPRINTAEWVTATLRAIAIILRTAALEPFIVSKTPRPSSPESSARMVDRGRPRRAGR